MSGVKHSALLQKCIQVIESYDPKKTTVDAHFADSPVMQDKKLGEPGSLERVFIHQIFYGSQRYLKLLKLFVTSFLYKEPTKARREDQTLYTIFSYILFFRLEDLGVHEFRHFYMCGLGTPPALLALLQYIFNEEDLNKWVKMEWCKLYDMQYIEEDIIGKLLSFREVMQPLIDDVNMKATGALASSNGGATQDTEKEKKITICEPFDLTHPKPRLIPEPDEVKREIKANPIPAHIHKNPLASVVEKKEARKEKIKKETQEKYPKDLHFNLETGNRPFVNSKAEIQKKVDEERYADCTFHPELVAGEYREPRQHAEVRQTGASVLREDALVKKKQLKEYNILKQFEEDLRDASGFYEWQQDMRERDQLEKELNVAQRKIEMQMARTEAIEAFNSMVRKKHIIAENQKEELQQALHTQEHEQHQQLQKKQQLVSDVQEERVRPREAEDAHFQANQVRAENMRKEKEIDMERKKKEDGIEMERKKDLIRQIRAIERVSVLRAKPFDPSEPPCQGYMEEMSLAELRERLKMVTAQQAKQLEDKRELNLKKKENKNTELLEKAENLSKIRDQAKSEAKERQAKMRARQEEEEAQRQRIREQCIIDAAEKIAQKKRDKKEEEARLRRELKEISIKRQFLQANAEMVEAKAHGEQQKGLEREARDRQNNLLLEQKMKNDVKAKEKTIRIENKAAEREDFKKMCEEVDKRLAQAKLEDTQLKEEIRKGNKTARTLQLTQERNHQSTFGWSANKYSTHKSGPLNKSTGLQSLKGSMSAR